MLADKEDMERRIAQRDRRSEVLTKQLAQAGQKAATDAAKQAAEKKRADENERHMQRLADAHTLLRKSQARIRSGEERLESVASAHRQTLEQLEASREQAAALRADVARTEARCQATCGALQEERERAEALDERLGAARHEAMTQHQKHAVCQATAVAEERQAALRLSSTERERDDLSRQLHLATSRLAAALERLDEERARRVREEERAAALGETVRAESDLAKETAQKATLERERAERESCALRTVLQAVRAELDGCRQQLEADRVFWSRHCATQEDELREAREEIARIENERRILFAAESDAQADNLRLRIALQGMRDGSIRSPSGETPASPTELPWGLLHAGDPAWSSSSSPDGQSHVHGDGTPPHAAGQALSIGRLDLP